MIDKMNLPMQGKAEGLKRLPTLIKSSTSHFSLLFRMFLHDRRLLAHVIKRRSSWRDRAEKMGIDLLSAYYTPGIRGYALPTVSLKTFSILGKLKEVETCPKRGILYGHRDNDGSCDALTGQRMPGVMERH